MIVSPGRGARSGSFCSLFFLPPTHVCLRMSRRIWRKAGLLKNSERRDHARVAGKALSCGERGKAVCVMERVRCRAINLGVLIAVSPHWVKQGNCEIDSALECLLCPVVSTCITRSRVIIFYFDVVRWFSFFVPGFDIFPLFQKYSSDLEIGIIIACIVWTAAQNVVLREERLWAVVILKGGEEGNMNIYYATTTHSIVVLLTTLFILDFSPFSLLPRLVLGSCFVSFRLTTGNLSFRNLIYFLFYFLYTVDGMLYT